MAAARERRGGNARRPLRKIRDEGENAMAAVTATPGMARQPAQGFTLTFGAARLRILPHTASRRLAGLSRDAPTCSSSLRLAVASNLLRRGLASSIRLNRRSMRQSPHPDGYGRGGISCGPFSPLPVVEDTFWQHFAISNRYNATIAVPQGLPALFQSATRPLCSGCQTARKCLCRRHCSVVAV